MNVKRNSVVLLVRITIQSQPIRIAKPTMPWSPAFSRAKHCCRIFNGVIIVTLIFEFIEKDFCASLIAEVNN